MAMSNTSDSVVLSNGSILSNAAGPGVVAANDRDITVQQLPSKETPRPKPSPNGCLQLNGTIKPSFLPLDNQRTQQMMSQCCHPCPYHHSLNSHNSKQECHSVVGSSASSPMISCHMQPHAEYSASICQKHTPVYQPACCLQPSPSFCLHHQWLDHFQHQPVQQHLARISFGVPELQGATNTRTIFYSHLVLGKISQSKKQFLESKFPLKEDTLKLLSNVIIFSELQLG